MRYNNHLVFAIRLSICSWCSCTSEPPSWDFFWNRRKFSYR